MRDDPAPGGAAPLAVGHRRRQRGIVARSRGGLGRPCRHALDEPDRAAAGTRADGMPGQYDKRGLALYRIAYFYCQQAERLYVALVATPREDLRVRTARASELAAIGMLLERHGPRRRKSGPTPAGSARGPVSTRAPGKRREDSEPPRPAELLHATAALGYYRQALKLLPDDSVLRCHEASAEFATSRDARAHGGVGGRGGVALEPGRELPRRGSATPRAGRQPGGARGGQIERDPDRLRHATLAAAYFGRALTEYRGDAETRSDELRGAEPVRPCVLGVAPCRGEHASAGRPGLEHGAGGGVERRRAIAVIKAKQCQQGMATPTRVAPAARSDPAVMITPATPADPAPASNVVRNDRRAPCDVDSVPRRLRPAAATAYASLGAVLWPRCGRTRPSRSWSRCSAMCRSTRRSTHVRWMLAQAHLCAASQAVQGDADGVAGSRPPD